MVILGIQLFSFKFQGRREFSGFRRPDVADHAEAFYLFHLPEAFVNFIYLLLHAGDGFFMLAKIFIVFKMNLVFGCPKMEIIEIR